MTLPTTLARVAAYGFPGTRAPMKEALSDGEWRALLTAATRERMTPMLAIAADGGALRLTEGQQREAVRAHEQAMRLCVLLERALVEVADELAAAGVEHRVLKGSAVAHLDYPDPAWRAFGDVDVLVTGADYDHTLEVLTAKGAHRRYHEVRPGFDRRFGKGACVVLTDGTQIDVHRTFVSGPFGLTVVLPELFETSDPFTLGGRSLLALDREHRFLHACYHASLGDVPARLVALRDVAQLALAPGLDADLVVDRARRWRAEAVVARALTLAWGTLDLEPVPLSDWADAHRPDRFETRALRSYTAPSRSYAAQSAAGIAAVRGVSAKAAYVRALLLADPEHVEDHDGSYRHRLERALRALASARRAG